MLGQFFDAVNKKGVVLTRGHYFLDYSDDLVHNLTGGLRTALRFDLVYRFLNFILQISTLTYDLHQLVVDHFQIDDACLGRLGVCRSLQQLLARRYLNILLFLLYLCSQVD